MEMDEEVRRIANALETIAEAVGRIADRLDTIERGVTEGVRRLDGINDSLRKNPPSGQAGR